MREGVRQPSAATAAAAAPPPRWAAAVWGGGGSDPKWADEVSLGLSFWSTPPAAEADTEAAAATESLDIATSNLPRF